MEPSDSGPERIGRYRIEGRLGSGGMGEVFLAWDEPLQRHVAIKRIRREAGLSGRQRGRFLCEAHRTARVSHPNVVQIFDLLVEDEAIVMEYIEGRTLGERLAAGRLEMAQVLRLALEIARGLAAAHEAGLVHRDLKAANVLITRAGEHAKIVDFGLAQPVVRKPEDPEFTRKGETVGTPHAMSPEQVRGEQVDERSDLFSFGSLFHEMLTGRPPFRGTDEFDSQWKVLHEEPVDPLTARMDLPVEAADLLLRLLEKNWDIRPESAREVIEVLERLQIAPAAPRPVVAAPRTGDHPSGEETILELPKKPGQPHRDRTPPFPAGKPTFWTRRRLLLAGAAALLLVAVATVLFLTFRPARPLRIAVILKTRSSEPELDHAGSAIQSAALQALTSLEKIKAVSPEEMTRVTGTPARIGKAVSADELLMIFVEREDGTALVTLERVAVDGGTVLGSPAPFNVPLGRDNRRALARTVSDKVQKAYSKDVRFNLDEVREDDYASFLDIQERVDDGQARPEDPARLEAIMVTSPKFVEAPLLAARIALSQFQARREPADLEHASKLVRRAQTGAGEDLRPLRLELQVALALHQLGEAERILEKLERLDPGDPETLPLQADLAAQQGGPEKEKEAEALLAEAVDQVPSWQNRYLLADFETRHGRIDAAREQIKSILKQSPENVWAREAYGCLELAYGSLDNAEQIYQGLLRDGSARERTLSNLATLRVLNGNLKEAAGFYHQALEEHQDHVNALINLAEVETELKDGNGAAAHYHRALDLLSKREAGAGLLPGEALLKAQCLARLGRTGEAVEIVTALSQKTDADPQLLFQSALVLSLAGEPADAVTKAKAALAGGISRRLFSGSDLRRLREDPELRQWFPTTS
jgi:tetratricopeptide (TPR) repeat protein/predicted Ser/Thr protein kinase